jgi:glycosyltransferase involved in cell wall biosynthesis
VHPYLDAADVFVMPSDFEGMPNAMMEAMAHGLPCVSTDRSGAKDIARDGIEALYCPTSDSLALAHRVCTLVDRPDERARIGSRACARIEEFSVERAVRTFDACLAQFVNHAGR